MMVELKTRTRFTNRSNKIEILSSMCASGKFLAPPVPPPPKIVLNNETYWESETLSILLLELLGTCLSVWNALRFTWRSLKLQFNRLCSAMKHSTRDKVTSLPVAICAEQKHIATMNMWNDSIFSAVIFWIIDALLNEDLPGRVCVLDFVT